MEQNQNNGPKNDGPKNKQSLLVILLCIMVSLVMFNVLGRMTRGVSSEVPYSQFIEMLEKGEVDRVVMKGETLTVTLKKQQKMGTPATLYTTLMEDASELVKRLEKAGVEDFNREKPNAATEVLYTILSLVLPVLLMFFLLSMLYKRMSKNGGMMGGVGKSKAKAYVQKETGITFKDVAGQDEAKESLQEVVDFLHNPGKYTTIGSKLPKG
ncbi:MAG: ATP-dependent metallopeptidase FtsH/Yme1/Tma family protein, partial [Blautia producta]